MKLQICVLHPQPLMQVALVTLLSKYQSHFELAEVYHTDHQLVLALSREEQIDVLIVGGIQISSMHEIFSKIQKKVHSIHVIALIASQECELRQFISGRGGVCLSDYCTSDEILHALYMISNAKRQIPLLADLSKREHDVILLAFQGFDTATIADKLFISRRTVQNHKLHIYKKTGIHSIEELRQQCRNATQK